MSKKILTILLIGTLVLGVTAVALAGPRQFAQRSAFRDLNLSDEQYDKAREINEDFFEKMDSLRQQYTRKSLELDNLTLQKEPDEKAIQKVEDELIQIRNEMLKLRDEKINKNNRVLTDKQLNELDNLREKNYYNNRRGYRGYGFGGCGFGPGFCRGFGRIY